jgi:hypothetical protein
MTPSDIDRKLVNIKRGEKVIYHTGCLQYDRQVGRQAKLIDYIAQIAWHLAGNNPSKTRKVTLTQKKIKGGYHYIATGI